MRTAKTVRYPLIALFGLAFAQPALSLQNAQGVPVQTSARAAELVSFDGMHQLAAAARRTGMLSQKLIYTLTIGPDGDPIACEINRDFRRKYIEVALCRPLLKYHKFKPARDANGQAVNGSFQGSIDFRMIFNKDGSSNVRDW